MQKDVAFDRKKSDALVMANEPSKMTENELTLAQRRAARLVAAANTSCPVALAADADQPPRLVGRRFWKTRFVRHYPGGTFSRTLYTPSTRRVEVGVNWLRQL